MQRQRICVTDICEEPRYKARAYCAVCLADLQRRRRVLLREEAEERHQHWIKVKPDWGEVDYDDPKQERIDREAFEELAEFLGEPTPNNGEPGEEEILARALELRLNRPKGCGYTRHDGPNRDSDERQKGRKKRRAGLKDVGEAALRTPLRRTRLKWSHHIADAIYHGDGYADECYQDLARRALDRMFDS